MKEIQVLGSGCAKCVKTANLVQAVADEIGVEVHVVKESSPEVMLKHGVMRTPAVVVDNQLVHSGSIPTHENVEAWLR